MQIWVGEPLILLEILINCVGEEIFTVACAGVTLSCRLVWDKQLKFDILPYWIRIELKGEICAAWGTRETNSLVDVDSERGKEGGQTVGEPLVECVTLPCSPRRPPGLPIVSAHDHLRSPARSIRPSLCLARQWQQLQNNALYAPYF